MPLAPQQADIARLIAANRSPSSHLAGGAALHLEPRSLRTSDDLDYIHDAEALVGKAFGADRSVLEAAGYAVDVSLSQPGFVRAVVRRDGAATKVEWAHDSAWHFLPPIRDPEVGFRLHPLDLAINKVLALAGRDEPRDFLDVIYVHRNHLSLGGLCWAAVGKDPGFSPAMLVEMLARKGRYRAEDFQGLGLAAEPDLADLKRTWLGAIADARRLVRELPPEDLGCLYWNPATEKFETPTSGVAGLLRHFGCTGGVLPMIGDAPVIESDRVSRSLLGAKLPAEVRAGARASRAKGPRPRGSEQR
jgi:hypothetical protein